jgi:transposase-like protein
VPRPLAADKRAAILKDIQAGKLSAHAIAKKHGVAQSTVSRIAGKDVGEAAFDRSQTQKATRAVEIDNRARRALEATAFLDDIARLRARAWEPYTVVVGTAQGAEEVVLALPPLGEVRSAYTAIGIVVDKHLALDRHDNSGPPGASDAVSMLDQLAAGIRAIAAQQGADEGA